MGAMKLTEKRFDAIVGMVSRGHYLATAAKSAGISKSTLANWRKRGAEEGEGIYYDFARAIDNAHAKGEAMLVDHVVSAVAGGDWRAAAWILERKYSERWRKKSHVEVGGVDGGPIEIAPVNEQRVIEACQQRLNAAEVKQSDIFD